MSNGCAGVLMVSRVLFECMCVNGWMYKSLLAFKEKELTWVFKCERKWRM